MEEEKFDFWHKITKWIDYNRGASVGLFISALLAIAIFGCEPKTNSLINPGQMITNVQLDHEIASLQSQYEKRAASIEKLAAELKSDIEESNTKISAAEDDLARKIEILNSIFATGSGLINSVAAGNIDSSNALGTAIQGILAIISVGLSVDVYRKGRKINDLKKKNNTSV